MPHPWMGYAGDCFVVRHPSASGNPVEAADAATGHIWRNYALLSGANRHIGGQALGLHAWLYCDPNGGAWVMRADLQIVGQQVQIDVYRGKPFGRIGIPPIAGAENLVGSVTFTPDIPSWYDGPDTLSDWIGKIGAMRVYPTTDGSTALINILANLNPTSTCPWLETRFYGSTQGLVAVVQADVTGSGSLGAPVGSGVSASVFLQRNYNALVSNYDKPQSIAGNDPGQLTSYTNTCEQNCYAPDPADPGPTKTVVRSGNMRPLAVRLNQVASGSGVEFDGVLYATPDGDLVRRSSTASHSTTTRTASGGWQMTIDWDKSSGQWKATTISGVSNNSRITDTTTTANRKREELWFSGVKVCGFYSLISITDVDDSTPDHTEGYLSYYGGDPNPSYTLPNDLVNQTSYVQTRTVNGQVVANTVSVSLVSATEWLPAANVAAGYVFYDVSDSATSTTTHHVDAGVVGFGDGHGVSLYQINATEANPVDLQQHAPPTYWAYQPVTGEVHSSATEAGQWV